MDSLISSATSYFAVLVYQNGVMVFSSLMNCSGLLLLF